MLLPTDYEKGKSIKKSTRKVQKKSLYRLFRIKENHIVIAQSPNLTFHFLQVLNAPLKTVNIL